VPDGHCLGLLFCIHKFFSQNRKKSRGICCLSVLLSCPEIVNTTFTDCTLQRQSVARSIVKWFGSVWIFVLNNCAYSCVCTVCLNPCTLNIEWIIERYVVRRNKMTAPMKPWEVAGVNSCTLPATPGVQNVT
jgi:hypothetical protein